MPERTILRVKCSKMDLLLVLLLGWSCLCCGYGDMLKDHHRSTGIAKDYGHREVERKEYTVSEHMRTLYSRYLSNASPLRDGNTVRSFKAHMGTINNKHLQIFNLTSLTKSEDVLSATLHYYVGGLRNSTRRCSRFKTCARHGLRRHVPVHLSIWSFNSAQNKTRTLDHFSVNVSSMSRGLISWQWRDITRVVNQAKRNNELLIGISMDPQGQQHRTKTFPNRQPYILVYANDSAILDSRRLESIVSTLQRYQGGLVPELQKLAIRKLVLRHPNRNHNHNGSAPHRTKRSANILLPLQNNELPGPEYPYEIHTWDETSPYDPVENKPGKRSRKKPRKNPRDKNPLLQFDEQTIKKARKKQWIEPKNCARRYLKVDFADIGWSEWIISPKSFDAYYCSGSCQFPMPKSLKPSNHATIQSIVRAVGVIQGIPEPCCVPEKMSPLSILFLDEDKNVVLKVYPNMTVDSCACR